MLVGRKAAWKRDFRDVKNEIDQRIRREAIAARRQVYIAELKGKGAVQLMDDVVAALQRKLARKIGVAEKRVSPSALGDSLLPPPFPGEH